MFRSTTLFDKLLEKATDGNKVDTDFDSILQITDQIRQGDCLPNYAFNSIKKKLTSKNVHTVSFTLDVLDTIVKNCGRLVHEEIASESLMSVLHDVLKSTQKEEDKKKVLQLVQSWAVTFKSDSKFKPVQELFTTLQNEKYTFPELKETDAMFAAEVAPDWEMDKKCYHCKIEFSVFTRRHHCRGCGKTFCQSCSSMTTTLPRIGFEKPVRVCQACYDKESVASSAASKSESEKLPAEYASSSLAQQKQAAKPKTAKEIEEEEEIQLALAMSESEAEAKEMERKRQGMNNWNLPSPQQSMIENDENEDSQLNHYFNRSHWEQKQAQLDRAKSPDRFRNSPPSAPETPTSQMENGSSEAQLNEFVENLKLQVTQFENRMRSNSNRGRSISNDTSVQTLFVAMTDKHSQLLKYIAEQDNLRSYYEGLQDKLAQVKDALPALEALREEHQEKLRREAEEAERLKQIQMAEKLQIMRKKKQEYLQQQRQMAIQKLQDEAREMHMRQQQPYMPYNYPAPYPGQPGAAPPMPQYQPMYAGYPVPPGMGMPQHQQPPIPQMGPVRQPRGPLPPMPMNVMPPHMQHMQPPMGHQSMPPGMGHPMAQNIPSMPPPGMTHPQPPHQQQYQMGPMMPPIQQYQPQIQQQPQQQQLQQQPEQSTAELIRFD